MLCYDGRVCLIAFTAASISASLPEVFLNLKFENDQHFQYICLVHVLLFAILNGLAALALSGFPLQVAVRAVFLGYVFRVGVLVFEIAPPSWRFVGAYMCVLAIFHTFEFMSIALNNPMSLTIGSFLMNWSKEFDAAVYLSWLEFIVEKHFFPGMKEFYWISYFGVVICFAGDFLRKMAVFTIGSNFNHVIQTKKADDHQLVMHGVYGLFRHPGYVGWFFWVIGIQLILQNPIFVVINALGGWRFVYGRIQAEEKSLLNIYGKAYEEYQKRVPTGVPFITGYNVRK